LYQCALEPDLELFEAGDETEVGEKGLTLSGGQKVRSFVLSPFSAAGLIRSIGSRYLGACDLFIGGDSSSRRRSCRSRCPYLQVDRGKMLQGRSCARTDHHFSGKYHPRTRAFLDVYGFGKTHNLALASPLADFIVAMNADGQIISRGSVSEVLENAKDLREEIEKERKAVDAEEAIESAVIDGNNDKKEVKKDGKLVAAEEVAVGRVSRKASALPCAEPAFCCADDLDPVNLLFASQGGSHPVLFWTTFIGFMLLTEIFRAGQV
jgi:hypothetical protein